MVELPKKDTLQELRVMTQCAGLFPDIAYATFLKSPRGPERCTMWLRDYTFSISECVHFAD
jgi:hypothetical protein